MEKMESIKNDTLKFAREYYNVSIEDVSIKTKINVELLQKYEEGNDFPSYAQLEKLANYYNRPLFFFFVDNIKPINKTQIVFRSIQKKYENELSKHTKELIEKADSYRMNLVELFENEIPPLFNEQTKDFEGDKSKLAAFLRKSLSLDLKTQTGFSKPEQLLEYIREKLFEIGVYVFKDSFKDDSISGLCIYDSKFPVVLINNKTVFTRQLFTIFHEIYHIYLKEADIDFINKNEEKECNKFASEFLIPSDDLLQKIDSIDNVENLEILTDFAKYYNVSLDAIMYRLVKMEELDMDFYKKYKNGVIRNSNGSTGGNFYYTRMSYLGNAYMNKVFSSFYDGKITKPQVGMYTGLKTVNVSKLASKISGGIF